MLKAFLIIIIMLVIVALILSAANDYRAGRIRIRFASETKHDKIIIGLNQDHICEQCGEPIPIEHPCNCQKCWNDLIGKYRHEIARLQSQVKPRPSPENCAHVDVLLLDNENNAWKYCVECLRKERAV